MWEFDDNRAIPTNLVLEQDFILRIRRLHRLGTPHLVANIRVSEIPADYSGRGTLEEAHRRLAAIALAQKGTYAEMTNGDVFLTWAATEQAKIFPEQAMMVTLPNGVAPDDLEKYTLLYRLPEEYALLRERANYYVDASRAESIVEDENAPARLLKTEAARGALSTWSLNQIERLIKDIDLCAFIRSQSVYAYQKDKSWRHIFDEAFIGLDDVKQAYFPHIDLMQPKHLFLELCLLLDRSLLTVLTQNYESVSDMNLSLNLTLPTVLGSEFAQFTRRILRSARSRIGFEIHCGDLMQDFTQTLNAIATLRQEGYKISIDSVTPDMMNYINFSRFDVDFIKVNASRDYVGMLKYPMIREGLARAPKDKLIFFRCDTEAAVNAGIDLGVDKFQGWFVDDLARKWRKV